MKASDLLVKCLEKEGVEYVFAVPGEENLDFVESLRESSIKLIVNRHEQAAAFMAATYGRLTGKAGVCMSTLGPGALNLVTGVSYAQLGGMPLIALTGQKGVRNNWQANFQIVDIVNTMDPLTKRAKQIVDPHVIPKEVRYSFKLAEMERPGACHLEIPEDVAETKVSGVKPHNVDQVRRPGPDPKAIDKALQLIEKAKAPIIIVSSGGNRKLVTKQLGNFVEKTGIYVVHTQLGKGVLSDKHPQSLFSFGLHKHDYINCAIDRSDLIITIGYDITEHPPYLWNKSNNKKILHIDFNHAEPDVYYNPTLEIVGDISHTLWALSEKIKVPNWNLSYYGRLRNFLDKKLEEGFDDHRFPVHPRRFVGDIRKALGAEDIITLDNGIYKIWVARHYKTYAPNTVLLDNTLATMGAGLPSAMAAKMVHPKKNVVAICGDGGFMMNSQELETAVRLKLNVVIIIPNDSGYGFIKWKQHNMGFKNFGLDFGNPDFVKYAESYGAKGYRITKSNQLSATIKKAFKEKGPVIIDCPIDYSDNITVLSAELDMKECPI